jgi:hypothetical protein
MGEGRHDIPVLKPGVDIATPDKAQPEIDAAAQKLYADTLPKTVQIATDKSRGSGFFLDREGTVSTAAHVVLGTREQFAITSDGSKYKLQIEKLDDVNDIAILKPVGLKPGSQPFAELESTKNLLPEQALYSMGHPNGLRPAYISPGTYNRTLSQEELFKSLDPEVGKKIEAGLKALTPAEVPGLQAALARNVIGADVHIQQGDSGGPVFNAAGKVIGMNDMITNFKHAYFTPVDKIRNLYENTTPGDFNFTYNRLAEPWVQDYKNTWLTQPVAAAAQTATFGGLGYLGYRLASKFPRATGVTASVFEGLRLLDDAGSLLASTDSADKWKFGIASAADLAGVAGGLAMLSSRYRLGGAIGLSVGIAGRIAADFIPNHLVLTNIQRKSNPLLPPMNQDVQKTLGL